LQKQTLIVVFLILALLSLTASPVLATRNVLWPPAYVQERDGWCWAAVDKSIIQYYKGSSPSQSTLAYTYDSGSPLDGATLDQANSALNGNGIRSSRQYNSLSYSGVQWQINNRHLIFARVTRI